MISVETSIRHLAWSNQEFFTYFEGKQDEVFSLRAADGEWTIGQLLAHLVNSESWFRYCLIGIDWSDFQEITNASMIQDHLKILAELDTVLLKSDCNNTEAARTSPLIRCFRCLEICFID